jgi:hypothetical protein
MTEGYVRFQSTRPSASCSFLYPADWQIREIVQDESTEFFIAGPRSRLGTYAVSFTVRVSVASQETLPEVATAFLSRYRSAPGFQEMGQASGTAAGCPAMEVEIGYLMPLPLNSVNAQATPIRERHIFLKQEDRLYELFYMALAEHYGVWLKDFRILVQTFTFLEEPVAATFHPLITPDPKALRVKEAEYQAYRSKSDEQSKCNRGCTG